MRRGKPPGLTPRTGSRGTSVLVRWQRCSFYKVCAFVVVRSAFSFQPFSPTAPVATPHSLGLAQAYVTGLK